MAEFCKQCAEQLFGDNPCFNDAAGLISEDYYKKGFVAVFLCEGCGPTITDHEGRCVSDCIEHHNPDKRRLKMDEVPRRNLSESERKILDELIISAAGRIMSVIKKMRADGISEELIFYHKQLLIVTVRHEQLSKTPGQNLTALNNLTDIILDIFSRLLFLICKGDEKVTNAFLERQDDLVIEYKANLIKMASDIRNKV